jgi:hypothetical protein
VDADITALPDGLNNGSPAAAEIGADVAGVAEDILRLKFRNAVLRCQRESWHQSVRIGSDDYRGDNRYCRRHRVSFTLFMIGMNTAASRTRAVY